MGALLSTMRLSQSKSWPLFSSGYSFLRKESWLEGIRKKESLMTLGRLRSSRGDLFPSTMNYKIILGSSTYSIPLLICASPQKTLDYLWAAGKAELPWSGRASWPGFPREVAAKALGPVSCTPRHLPQRPGLLCTEPEQVVWYEVCPQTSSLWILHHVGRHRKFEVTHSTPTWNQTQHVLFHHLTPFCGCGLVGRRICAFSTWLSAQIDQEWMS